jgi:hypothetical protein
MVQFDISRLEGALYDISLNCIKDLREFLYRNVIERGGECL